jgi:poly(ribitol-phosphate) beta-N-acetylglucosaminyltransferase
VSQSGSGPRGGPVGAGREKGGDPDVSVVVPVYNTMPYLQACLDSLVRQSLGPGRLEVIAVDDGSTDGSGAELERYAEDHPGLFTVVHQENSGGPAAPCNVGLDLAAGRFVFFLGADDYLDDHALEDLLTRADEWDSDVIFGRMVGVGDRWVSQRVFQRTERELPFPHSALPFSLSNTKLFRRSLLDKHSIRYPLDLRVGSDQPFTIAAMLHARRISVLADKTYYYAVRRDDAANISFSSGWRDRLEDIGQVMEHVAGLLPPGDERDAILHRHFAWELNSRLRQDLPELDGPEAEKLCAVVAALADRFLTDGVSRRLTVRTRVAIRLAQSGNLDALVRMNALDPAGAPDRQPELALMGGSAYLAYPGFENELPIEWFEATNENLQPRLRAAVRLTSVSWEGTTLVLTARTALHPDSVDHVRLALVPLRAGQRAKPFRALAPGENVPGQVFPVGLERTGAPGATLTARVDLGPLLGGSSGPSTKWALTVRLHVGPSSYELPARGGPDARATARVGRRFFELVTRHDRGGRILVVVRTLPVRDVLRQRLQAWRR